MRLCNLLVISTDVHLAAELIEKNCHFCTWSQGTNNTLVHTCIYSMRVASKNTMLSIRFLLCCFGAVASVQSAPITITRETFAACRPGSWANIPVECCPPKTIEGPIVDFKPDFHPSKPLRVRKALQCLAGEELEIYTQKLYKGYALMRALPDSDPRSFMRQNQIHCAYGTGSFVQDGSTNLTMDIHLNWFFLPWHRLFVYFHERILQKLLNDADFSLHFWNFDNSEEADGDGDGCYKAGHFVPPVYADLEAPTFERNRTSRAFDPANPVYLDLLSTDPRLGQPVFHNYTVEEAVRGNKRIMHRAVAQVHDVVAFVGRPRRVGDPQILDASDGAGTLEWWPHITLHNWVGGFMFQTQTAPLDPIFYIMHANVERLWKVWRSLSPANVDPADPDFLDAAFLLWDENAVLRRIRVRDVLHTEALGYTYEKVNDASWIFFDNSTSDP
ncbi:polyphenol oxidase [Marchantia polymorpha subsp. ruderalis]